MDERRAAEALARAKAEGRDALTELEGLELLAALGIEAPHFVSVRGSAEVGEAALPAGERAVVKVISPEILHKTEAGGVAIVPNRFDAIRDVIAGMEARFSGKRVDAYTIHEFAAHSAALGHELIAGFRFAADFGPVVSFGPGGIYAEHLATSFREGSANLFLSPITADRALVEKELSRNALVALVSGGLRGTKPAIERSRIADLLGLLLEAAPRLAALGVSEFEVNPFAVVPEDAASGRPARLVALDVLVKLARPESRGLAVSGGRVVNPAQAARPADKIDKLLRPASAAVIGVSEKGMNNGRIILRNLLANGFPRGRLYVVKLGAAEIDGCACVPDLAALPEKVDLFVVVIPAAQAAACIAELAERDAAESVVVIPGGLEEKAGTEAIVARMRESLAASRAGASRGPALNGGNCLGVRSVPGRYNTLFIPEYKLPMPSGEVAPVALVSQSGAFAVSRISKHPYLNPKYAITCGNQMDLTVGDYLDRLADDGELEVFAVYLEGFKPLDGEKALEACRRITRSGRSVILYRAGRTAAGAAASASHTASIAGDYPVTRELFRQAGAAVASSLDEFDDLVRLFRALGRRRASGRRLGAVSNAGFECVAFADNLGSLEMARLSAATDARLAAVLEEARIASIVDLHNPLDLTPSAGDAAYEESFRAILDDPGVDCGIAGDVPLTAALNSLPPGPGHGEDFRREDSVASRYARLMAESTKPWAAVVDAGPLYDPFARELESRGVPVFRSADRALRALNVWMDCRLGPR